MTNPREIDRIRALELALPGLGLLRRLRQDVRRGAGQVMAYLDETGGSVAWTGDEEAPYVKAVPETPRVVNLIPRIGQSGVPIVPIMQAFTGPGRVVEVWATDLRDQSLSPPTIYLQLFDSEEAPQAGDVPTVTALPLCRVASYEWANGAAFLVGDGLWVALSSTGQAYTPLPPTTDFSITARVLP